MITTRRPKPVSGRVLLTLFVVSTLALQGMRAPISIWAKGVGGAGQEARRARPCLYDSVLRCLVAKQSFNGSITSTTSFHQLDAFVEGCVLAWNTISSQPRASAAHWTPTRLEDLGTALRDRVDWTIYKLGLGEDYQSEIMNACGAISEGSLSNWIKALPAVTRGFEAGGSYLPPWYEMDSTEEAQLALGYQLPRGPLKQIPPKFRLNDDFRAKIDNDGFRTYILDGMVIRYNLGDCFNHYLLGLVSGVTHVDTNPKSVNKPLLCMTGSVFDRDCDVVWGSGLMDGNAASKFSFKSSKTEVYAARGPLTLSLLDGGPNGFIALGDPGLLASLIFPLPEAREEVDFCVIPHYIDQDNPTIQHLLQNMNDTDGFSIRLLNIATCSFDEFVAELSGCKMTVSSSLHGLIFSLSYGIHGVRMLLSDKVGGGHFKFKDFYSGIGYPDLYHWEDVRNGMKIPFRKIAHMLRDRPVPRLNMEDLWNSNPVHAQNQGKTRGEHLANARNWTGNLHHFYPHKMYTPIKANKAQAPNGNPKGNLLKLHHM